MLDINPEAFASRVQPLGEKPSPDEKSGEPDQAPSRHPQQLLVLEIQDRFGCLFLDFKGSQRACFMFAALKQISTALRGVLLGVFIGGALFDNAPCLTKLLAPSPAAWPLGVLTVCLQFHAQA
jgi:hypothetical protein